MISYAQNSEDVMLWRALKDIRNGRYVDVGAFHPEVDSVTKWFYDQGWSGVNIEPVPESFALLQAARPRDHNVCAAAGATAGTSPMVVYPTSAGLSFLAGTGVEEDAELPRKLEQVQVLPLREILSPYAGQPLHFLKIDAEGSERNVLLGMDFACFRPWIVLVEATAPRSPVRTAQLWEEILINSGYDHVYFDGLNEFYLASEKQELAEHFLVPPNVFDNFELAVIAREREAHHALQCALTAENERLRIELAASREQASESAKSLQMILNSKSWRLLAPLRWFRSLVLQR